MNWINMLPWYQWLILGLVPPLIFMLYFLKLRRTPVEVPSTYLWTKTVEDMHVNSIWQKLRKNLLLLLQLLAVICLILSCLRPGCDGEQLAGDRFIFLVDQSASMSATDTDKGVSRLQDAKDQVCSMIDQMKSSDAAMVISFSNSSIPVQSFTNSKAILKTKVRSIKQTQKTSDINEALLAASGLANPGRTSDRNSETDVQVAEALPATMYIFSDGALKKVPNFFLGNLTPEYRPVGSQLFEPPENVGIIGFAINDQLEGTGQVQVFARLLNSGLEDKDVGVSLFVGDELSDARKVEVRGGGGSTSLNFDLTNFIPDLEAAKKIKLQIDDKDVYMQDNEAFCILNPPRTANVLVVTDLNDYLKLAMSTTSISKLAVVNYEDRDFLETKEYREAATLGVYDLVIFDQCVPKTMPQCNAVFMGEIPPGERWKVVEEVETAPIVDAEVSHPVMFDVRLGNVNILSSKILKGPQGTQTLIESVKGPIMAIATREGFEDLVLGFPLLQYTDDGVENNTDWQKDPSFPFFIQNLIYHMAGASRLNSSQNSSPGDVVKIKPEFAEEEVTVKMPDGKKVDLKSRSDNSFLFAQADKSGIYEVGKSGSNEVDQMFAVNLLDRLESDLTVREKLDLGFDEVKAKGTTVPMRKDFWTALCLIALVIITIEWYIYNKRIFI